MYGYFRALHIMFDYNISFKTVTYMFLLNLKFYAANVCHKQPWGKLTKL